MRKIGTMTGAAALALGMLWAALPAGRAEAHEFWIAPLAYQVPDGAALLAELRVGQMMEGSAFAYVPPNFERFEIVMNGTTYPVEGRAGDRPALRMPAPEAEGLAVVVHQTRAYKLTYPDWERFVEFTQHKDFTWAAERHLERGFTQESVVEEYIRYAKSLIGVGSAAGADSAVGLRAEVVAETNPYTDDLSQGFTARILYEGAPLADTQVELFDKAPGAAAATSAMYRTDAEGRVTLPVEPGHEYLVDAVVMNEIDPAQNDGQMWQSLWASLTFKTPM